MKIENLEQKFVLYRDELAVALENCLDDYKRLKFRTYLFDGQEMAPYRTKATFAKGLTAFGDQHQDVVAESQLLLSALSEPVELYQFMAQVNTELSSYIDTLYYGTDQFREYDRPCYITDQTLQAGLVDWVREKHRTTAKKELIAIVQSPLSSENISCRKQEVQNVIDEHLFDCKSLGGYSSRISQRTPYKA